MSRISYHERDECVDITTYSSGETHVQVRDWLVQHGSNRCGEPSPEFVIEWPATTWTDVMSLVSVDRALWRLDVPHSFFMPYLPFARDDRRRTRGCGNELDLAIELLKVPDVVIADPHSYASEILPHISAESIAGVVDSNTSVLTNNPVIVIPDQGAKHKVTGWAWPAFETVQGDKTRNKHTGALSGFSLEGAERLKGREVVIFDDICDGGGTFVGLLDLIRKAGPAKVSLVVTHGLFTKGRMVLSAFDQVVTFGPGEDADWIKYIPWKTLYLETNKS